MSNVLKVGDKVMWRGTFGMDPVKEAVVVGIEVTSTPRTKYGTVVEKTSWNMVKANRTLLSLDNGHWCYGEQVSEIGA